MSEVMRYKTPANGVTDDAFPAEIREAAYQLWAYICDRNASRVSRSVRSAWTSDVSAMATRRLASAAS